MLFLFASVNDTTLNQFQQLLHLFTSFCRSEILLLIVLTYKTDINFIYLKESTPVQIKQLLVNTYLIKKRQYLLKDLENVNFHL